MSRRSKIEPNATKKKRTRGKWRKRREKEKGKTAYFALLIFNERIERRIKAISKGKMRGENKVEEPIIRLIPKTLGEEEIEVAKEKASKGIKSTVMNFLSKMINATTIATFPINNNLYRFTEIYTVIEDLKTKL